MKILLITLLLSVTFPVAATESTAGDAFVAPPAGSQFYLSSAVLSTIKAGETFEILDDRYLDVVIHARIVSVEGDVALVEIVEAGSRS